MKFLFPLLLCWSFCQPSISQVVHAGPWTAYLDGNGISNMTLRDSFMYIQTANGLAFFNTNTRQTSFFCDFGNPDIPLSTFQKTSTIDQKGQFWIVYNNQLVCVRPDGTMKVMGPKPLYQINVMEADRNGQIWVGMVTAHLNNPAVSTCLAKFDGSDWEYVSIGVTRMNVSDLKFDYQNHPVIATKSIYNPDGLYWYNGINFVHTNLDLYNLTVSADGQLAGTAIGPSGTVLKVYKNGVWNTYDQSGPTDQIDFVYPVFDANNTLWTINQRGKVFRLNNAGILQTLSPPVNLQTGESFKAVSGLAVDNKGRLWLAEQAGLFLAADPNLDKWDFIQTAPMLIPHKATTFYGYRDTVLLCSSNRVTRVVNQTAENLNWQGPIPQGFLRDYHRDGLWAYNGATLTLYRSADTTVFNLAPMFPEPFYSSIKSVLQGSDGSIWIINTRTVIRYTLDNQWTSFDVGAELPPYNILAWALDGSDMWVFSNGIHINHPTITQPGAHLVKIKGNNVTDSGLTYDFLKPFLSFAPVSDTDLWFTGGDNQVVHLQNGSTTMYTQQDIGGTLNAQKVFSYNDSTLLLCSNFGLYIFYRGEWHIPKVPSNRFSNSNAYTYLVGTDGKIYLDNRPLVVLEDIQKLLSGLTSSPASPDPDASPSQVIYPNPTSDLLHIEQLLQRCPDCSLSVASVDGRLLAQFLAPIQSPISLHTLPSGTYVLSQQKAGKVVGKSLIFLKKD